MNEPKKAYSTAQQPKAAILLNVVTVRTCLARHGLIASCVYYDRPGPRALSLYTGIDYNGTVPYTVHVNVILFQNTLGGISPI
jgi:hypothetical protein